MANEENQNPAGANAKHAGFMVLQGSDGAIYEIPLDELKKFRVSDDDAKLYSTDRVSSISCRISCK